MARKLTLADLDFSNPDNNPDWADAIRKESEEAMRQREERRSRPSFNNIVSEVDSTSISPGAFANTVSGSVSSTERQSLEERFTLPNLAAAGVEAIADFVTTPYTEALGDKMGANVDRIVAGGAATVGDASVVNPIQMGSDIMRNAGSHPLGASGAILEAYLRQVPAAAKTATGLTQEEGLEIAKQRTASGEARDARADAVIAEMTEGRSTPYTWLVEGTADVAGSGSSFLSVFGGPTAAITYGDVYLQEYGAARAAGLSPDQAADAANGQAAVETSLSILPSGRIGKRLAESIPGVKQGIEAIENRLVDGIETVAGKAIYTGVEAAKTATGESVQEMTASTGQDIVRRFQGLVGEEKAREYAQQNVVALENYPEMLRRSGVAGFMMGGGIRTPTAAVEAVSMGEASQELRTGNLEAATIGRMQEFNNFVEGSNARTQEREAKAETELDLDIAREEERIRNEEARTAAFEQAEAERAEAERRAAEQKELEEEAGFQTIERDADLPRDRVERYADVVERVPVNPAQEITPEQVQEQRQREVREQVEQQQRAEQGQRIEFLRKRQEEAQAREAKAKDAEQKKRNAAQKARERKIADEVIAANPNATPAELETIFAERIAQPAAEPVVVPEPAQETAPAQTSEPAPQEAPAKTTPKPTVKKADRDATDEELDAILEWANSNLGMAASGETAPLTGGRIAPTVDMEAYKAKVKPLIRNLVKRTSKDSRSFQKLILQDKLRIVPNASTMGFREQGRVAEYDANEGKLYLYTDALEANGDVVPAIARAFHEATHAGQFNDREGRSNLYRHFLGDKKTSEAAKKIRKAAAQGNRLASDALADAQRDTAARQGDNQYEDLELVAYFTNRVVEGRGSALGSVGGVVRDLTTAARQWLRDGVGLDLEVSLGDLQTAAANVGSEIADTDVRGLRGRDSLGMTADDINETPMYRGSPEGTEGIHRATDGALGPGYYLTSSRQAAEGYGPVVGQFKTYVSNPLVITMQDLEGKYENNTALAIADNDAFANENFWTKGHARRWAREQWEDWVGIGDEDFPSMVRSAGFDALAIVDGDTVVELNVLSPNNIAQDEDIRLGMSRVDAESGDFAATDTPEFRRWFGNSTVVNEDGSPRTMYHGTKDAFNTFRVNDLGLIFASPSETFAEAYAGINEFTLEQNPAIPLYVRAENTWDYENPEHRALLINNEASMNRLRDYFSFLTREDSANMSAEELDAFIVSKLAMGDWDLIEQAVNVEAIKAAGFDSLNVFEGNAKNIAVFEPNQFKHATENKGAWSLDNDNMFGMAAPTERRTSARVFDTLQPSLDLLNNIPVVNLDGQKIRMAGTGLLRNDKGLGYDILTAWEHAKAWPAAEEARARASLGKYRKGIKRYAAANNMTVEQVNEQIMQELDGIDNQENKYSENKKAWENVLAKYGEAGQHMMDMRNQVDAMSLDMLRSLYSSGRTLSPREMKRLATIAANMGRYTHRMYAAHLGEAGNKYATAVLEAWNKKRKNPNKRLSDAQERSYAVVQNAVEVLINDHLLIPEDADLFQLDAEATRRLYNTWVNSTTGIPVETMQTELADRRDSINGDKNRLDNEAERIVKDLLGLLGADSATGDTATAIGRYYRGGKTDTGILQERKKIPVALRTLMGELDEPGSRMLATVAKQAEFVARTRMLESFKDIASPQDLQPPDATGTDIVRDNDMKQLTGEGYGPLEGWWASPNMQAMIGDVREQLMGLEQAALMASNRPADTIEAGLRKIYEKWTGVAALSKGLQIVGNSFLYPLNFAGSFFMLSSNGNYNPAMWARGWKDASMLIANAANPSVGLGSADLAVRYGVTDSATIGELKGVQYQELQKLINEMAGTSKPVAILKAIKDRGIATATEAYAMADVWSKIANFHFEADQLRSYYKANNETRSDEEIYKEAANIVNSTNLSYKRAMPFFKAIERGGITHFGTYFYEVFRSQIHNAARGAWELSAGVAAASTPAAKAHMLKRGTTRLAGQAAVWAFFNQASQYLNDMLFGEDDEELRAKRSVLPDFMQNQDLYPFGIGKDGKPVYYGMSRIDPIGPITDIMRESMHGEVSWDSAKQQLLDLYVMPRIAPQLFQAALTPFYKDHENPVFKEPLLKQLSPEGYAALSNTARPVMRDNTLNAWVNAAEAAFLPGTFNAYRDTNPEIVGPIGDSTGTANAANISRYFGATFVQAQPARMMGQRFRDYDSAMKDGRAAIKNMFSNNPSMSADDAVRNILPLINAEREAWEGMVLVQHGMEAWQLDEDTISDAYSRVNDKRVLRSVRNEEFQSFMIDKTSLDSAKNRELRDAVTAEEKEQVEEKWEAVWETLQVVAGEIE